MLNKIRGSQRVIILAQLNGCVCISEIPYNSYFKPPFCKAPLISSRIGTKPREICLTKNTSFCLHEEIFQTITPASHLTLCTEIYDFSAKHFYTKLSGFVCHSIPGTFYYLTTVLRIFLVLHQNKFFM